MNAVAEPIDFQRAELDGAVYIPCTLIAPSKTNPRKRFDDSYIASLAESIKKVGVFQPILVRPLAGRVAGGPQYELVAGECRWRASQKADAPSIPALVRDLDDMTALEVQMAENIKRRNLHPLEEAEGYEQMLRKPDGLQGFTVEELAARFDVSVRFIYNRLSLLKLVPSVRELLYDDKLSASVALKISGLAHDLQQQAAEECLKGWAGEPFSARQAEEHLRKRYMLTLSKAVFDIKDATLVAKAGACTSCPKRTGANPDLFEDTKAGDACTDTDCFESKKVAHADREIKQAKDAGLKVLVGADAKKVMPYGRYSLQQTGHVQLDQAAEELTGTKQRLTTLLGDDFAGTILVKSEHDDVPLRVAKKADVEAALKAKGLLRPSKKTPVGQPAKKLTADDIKKDRDRRISQMLDERALRGLAKHLNDDEQYGLPDEDPDWMRALARQFVGYGEIDAGKIGAAVTGKHHSHGDESWLKSTSTEQVVRAILLCVLCEELAREDTPADAKVTDKLAKGLGYDLAKLRKEVATEVDSAIRDEIEALKAPLAKQAKGKKPAPSKSQSTPSKSAAAQGAKSAPQTPEEALAAAVAQDQAKKPAKAAAKAAAGAAPKGKKEVKDATPKAPAKKASKASSTAGPGKEEQKVDTARPPATKAPELTPAAAWPFPKRQD